MLSVAPPEPAADGVAKRGRGRPAIITLPLVQEVGRLIAKGMTEEQACLRVGINHGSFRTARHRSPEFDTAIKDAQAAYVDESLDLIGKGGRGWQGRAWILERRHGEQFRRNSGLEVAAFVAPFTPADLLARKPFQQWTAFDIDQSIGAWKLLKKLPQEQLEALLDLYERHWGPRREWTDQQLEWGVEVERCMKESTSETSELPDCEIVPNGEVHALIPA